MEKPAEELLCAAAASGNCARLRKLIEAGADSSFFDSNGMTPLMHAAAGNHVDAVRCLLDAGAPWNALSPSNLSAGDLAMNKSHQEAFDVLLNFAIQAELVLGTVARRDGSASDDGYLSERIAFVEDKIMDAENKAVMMAWEKPLMEAHARAICALGDGCGRILNVGFGMGLVDEAIQRYKPQEHTIVEAHPEVFERMIRDGWREKENVKIVFGKWQDVIPQLGSFDGLEGRDDVLRLREHVGELLVVAVVKKPPPDLHPRQDVGGTRADLSARYTTDADLVPRSASSRTSRPTSSARTGRRSSMALEEKSRCAQSFLSICHRGPRCAKIRSWWL